MKKRRPSETESVPKPDQQATKRDDPVAPFLELSAASVADLVVERVVARLKLPRDGPEPPPPKREVPTPSSRWLTPAAAADWLGYRPKTLENWRASGIGPRFSRSGRSGRGIRYDVDDLDAWLRSQRETPRASSERAEHINRP